MEKVTVRVVNKSKFDLPEYKHLGDSGMDVRANIEEPITLNSLERYLVPTGLYFELPENYEIQVRPRSGLAAKYGLTVLNTPGTVDEGYTGQVMVILINLSNEPYTIAPGERIAQLVLAKVEKAELEEVLFLNETVRGESGFGSSGKL
jgi:dUTP pyrophosphatase